MWLVSRGQSGEEPQEFSYTPLPLLHSPLAGQTGANVGDAHVHKTHALPDGEGGQDVKRWGKLVSRLSSHLSTTPPPRPPLQAHLLLQSHGLVHFGLPAGFLHVVRPFHLNQLQLLLKETFHIGVGGVVGG